MTTKSSHFLRHLLCVGILTLPSLLWAASPMVLTLEDAIFMALRNHPDIRSAQLQRVIDKYNLKVAENAFEMQYALQGSLAWQEVKREGKTFTDRGFNLTPGISKRFAYGGSASLGFNQNIDEDGYNPAIFFKVTQPLLRGFGKDVTLAPLYNAQDQARIDEKIYTQNVMQFVNGVIKTYRSLLQAKLNVNIQAGNLEQAKQYLEQVRARIQAGKQAPRDEVEAQRQISEQTLQLEMAENNYEAQLLRLKRELWLDPEKAITIPENIDDIAIKPYDLQTTIDTAFNFNIPYAIAKLNIQQSERQVLVAKDNTRPDLTFNAQKTFNSDLSQTGVKRIATDKNSSTTVELVGSIPIHDIKREATAVDAKTRLQQAKLQLEINARTLEDDVKNAIRDLNSKAKQIKLSEQTRQLAEESLMLEQRKQEAGKASLLDVSTARRQLISAQQTVLTTRISYLNAQTDLQVLLGILLNDWDIQLIP